MYKPVGLVWVLFLLPFLASAQEGLLTIQDAVSSAFGRNTELQQLRLQLTQKENQWRTETGISSPELSYLKEGIGSGPGQVFDEKRITVSQEIDFPLTISYRLKALAEEVKAMDLQIQSREREIKATVKSSYIEVLYARELQKSRENQLKLMEGLYKAVFTKYETGMANGMDLTNASLRVDEAKNDLDQSEWILHKARYGLFYAMGLPVEDQKYSILFSDTLHTYDIEISQIQSLSLQDEQPDYLASMHALNASGFYLKEAKSNILPDIRFNLYKQDYGTGYNFTGFEVGLKFPLWFPLDQKGNVNIAVAKQEEIRWKQEGIKLNMKKEIEFAWHNYIVSRSIIDRYNETMKKNAGQLQNLTLRAYQLGEIDLLNLLNAQQLYLNSEQRYLSALRDYYLQLVALEKYHGKDLVY
jgi:cobalt-zinc-cadmium efflux system outer membrane protein